MLHKCGAERSGALLAPGLRNEFPRQRDEFPAQRDEFLTQRDEFT